MSDRSLTVKLGEETLAALEWLAHETGRFRDQLAKEALTRYVDYETWKAAKIRHAMGQADADDFATDEEMEAAFDRYRHAAEAERGALRSDCETGSDRDSGLHRTRR